MATNFSTIEYLLDNLSEVGDLTYKKMFGEYMIYLNGKPIFLICNDTLYVKMLPEVEYLLAGKATDAPYNGAKPHYIVDDIDDKGLLKDLAIELEKVIPLPKPKKKKTL